MKVYVSSTELCRNLAISVGHGTALRELLNAKGVEKKGASFERAAALELGQEFVKELREKSGGHGKGQIGVHKNITRRQRKNKVPASYFKLMLAVGETDILELTMEQARELYSQLRSMFEGQAK